ncbi:MAG: hypothetical protein ACLU5J_08770 [Christensenellales bacterium]
MSKLEILSKQHYQTISQILKDDKEVKIGLLTGSTPLKQRKEMIEKIASGDIHIIIELMLYFKKI